MSENQGVRRTERVNAGLPPERLGEFVTTNYRRKSNPQGENQHDMDETLRASAIDLTSRRSHVSVNSQIRQLDIEIQNDEELGKLEEEVDTFKRDVTLKELDVNRLRKEVEDARQQLIIPNLTEEEKKTWEDKVAAVSKELEDLVIRVERGKVELQFEVSKLARMKALLAKKAERAKLAIQEETNLSQELSEDGQDVPRRDTQVMMPPDTRSAVEQWALTAELLNVGVQRTDEELDKEQQKYEEERARLLRNLQPDNPPANKDENGQDEDETDEERLLRRFENLKNGTGPERNSTKENENQSNIGQKPNSVHVSTREGSSIDQLAQVLANAFQKAIPQSTSAGNTDTSTLLARQVQGKDLPNFSGKPEEWPAFITALESSTKSCRFTNADNLIRLQRCLKDEAKKTVQCLLVSPESVPKAIEKLKMRFGRPSQIIESLINRVREVGSIKQDRLETLIDFGMAVENLTSTIIALNQKEHLCNPMLITELVKKLPYQSQIEWVRHTTRDGKVNPTLKDFAEWLSSYTEAACILCPYKSKNSDEGKSDSKRFQRSTNRIFTTKEEKTTSREPATPRVAKCASCNKEGHRIYDCSSFTKDDADGRFKIVKSKFLCFGCLNAGHSFKDCRSKRECGQEGCNKKHHKLLHPKEEVKSNKPREEDVKVAGEVSGEEIAHCVTHYSNASRAITEINVAVLPVRLRGPDRTITCFAELDLCSTVTTLDSQTSEFLKLKGNKIPLTVKGFQSTTSHPNSQEVELEILPIDSEEKYAIKAKTVSKLDLAQQSLKKEVLLKWKHLKDLDIQSYDNVKPKILIGLDNIQLLIPREVKCGKGDAPFAMKTLLGWVLMGNVADITSVSSTFQLQEVSDDILHKLVKDQFTTEAFGISPTNIQSRSRDDIRAQLIMDSTLKRVDIGYEIGLLWKDDNPALPESRTNALRRLYQMERRMDADADFASQYLQKIDEYQDKGFARILTKDEASHETSKTFYLPHFMARNPKKPNKLRFVFDAASNTHGSCLNDFLLQGPGKMASLPGVLLKFRQRKIAITADIQDMFHRVRVRPEDAQAQRFLWRGFDRDREPDVFEMSVLIFGATCSPACATEVKNVNAMEHRDVYPEACNAIVNRHYVDDYLDSVDTADEATERYNQIREVHAKGGFNITSWLSYSREFLNQVPLDQRAKLVKQLDMSQEVDMERILGLFWKPDEDVFTFNLTYLRAKEDVLKGIKMPTKREMLSLTMSIYDPLGFISILTVKARMILQQTWRSKSTWNDEIPAECCNQWKSWVCELKQIPTFILSRCYSVELSTADETQLHVFVDASEEAFGCAAYLRIKKLEGVSTAFVMSKAKVAPLKSLSIPRLELQAALMGCRLAKFIKEEHEVPINQVIFWSDSRTVICWLRSDSKRFHQFVSHRVGEIHELSDVSQWRWTPTEQNVADELTRFAKPCDWSPRSRWLNGPSFLLRPESEWPQEPKKSDEVENDDSSREIKRGIIMHVNAEDQLIDPSEFSTWTKLIHVTAYVLRFASNLKHKTKHTHLALQLQEIRKAETYWVKIVQQQAFLEETAALQKGEEIPRSSRLFKLNPFLGQDGIIRVRGRIENANVPEDVKRPIILEPKHPCSRLLVHYYHVLLGHHGQEKIVNEIRQKFYMFHVRAAVKAAQLNCQFCKNFRSRPVPPFMGQLPVFRLESNVSPFMKTGVDYFGPIEVVVKRSREKRYGVLFTCLSTRAIHLEVAHSLSTDSCVLAIRRFVGRRGCPAEMHSDNGTNFHGAANEMKAALRELDQDILQQVCSSRGISWSFIPPSAPHMGGSWERLVRSVKVALGNVLTQKVLHDEVLNTLFIEAEHSVNSHPLTHVPDDLDDLEALTPNHFLIGRLSNLQSMGRFDKDELFGRKQWRIVQQMANCFWRRWIREYLPTLLRRDKWNRMTKPIQEGDIVIEVNENLPRNSWPKGVVTKTYPGRDKVIRVVDIKLGNGHSYKRPVSKLCILDVLPKEPAQHK